MQKYKIERLIGGISASGLVILLLAILACPNFSKVGALSSSDFTANDVYNNEAAAVATAETSGSLTRAWVKPTLSIALAGVLDINAGVSFANGITDLKVATNSERGLTISINSVNTTDLLEMSDANKAISVLEKDAKPAEFPEYGGWGYYVDTLTPTDDSRTYKPFTTTATVAKTTATSSPVDINTFRLGIGVKASSEVGTGVYTNTVMVSAIANPIAITTLSQLTYMQDMTPEICKNTPNASGSTYSSKKLRDMRDGEEYVVIKYKDGNCWTQEDLRFRLDENVPLTPLDSDVTENRTLPTTLEQLGVKNSDVNGKLSWGPLDYNSRGPRVYYQWNAATAGTGEKAPNNGDQASDSVCPKGFKLPLSGKVITQDNWQGGTFDGTSGSYGYLFRQQGVSLASYVNVEPYPLLFRMASSVRDGTWYSGGGFRWSRVAFSTTTAYNFYYDTVANNVYPSNHYYFQERYGGMPIRCVAVSAP